MSRAHQKRKHNSGSGPTSPAAAPAPPAPTEEQVREATFLRWEAAGCPPGDGVDFWLLAEAELRPGRPAA